MSSAGSSQTAHPTVAILQSSRASRAEKDSSTAFDGFTANLGEEGYVVTYIDSIAGLARFNAASTALVTIDVSSEEILGTSLSNNVRVAAAVHYSSRFLAEQDKDKQHECLARLLGLSSQTTLFHLRAEQMDPFKKAASSLPNRHIVRPFDPSSEAPVPHTGPLDLRGVKTYAYPNLQQKAQEAPHWAVCLPFSHHTREVAFGASVDEWMRSAAGMSYTRTLDVLKTCIGPRWDLEELWEQHTYFEFATRDSRKTMSTMVSHPYVNHIATMTGGAGYDDLLHFYTHNFVTRSPPDTELIPISRTVGADRIVDEMIFKCTHTEELDYFLPGIEPTGKEVRIPMVGIVSFRGGKLAFESLYWDQASTLAQVGVLDPDRVPAIAGREVAEKVLDPYGRPSNTLFKGGSLQRWQTRRDDSIARDP